MELNDIVSFQFKRVNPFEGLVVDADTWRDAHTYHRDQQRLHVLAYHQIGIVSGLEVTASDPADQSVTIHPGMGIDPEGNVIIVPEVQRHKLQTREKAKVYLVIQFREIPAGPHQPPDGGEPTRILEAYRIQERDKLPDEPYLELARIDYDPSDQAVGDTKDPLKPGKNEIDLRSRLEGAAELPEAVPAAPSVAPPAAPSVVPPAPVEPEKPSAAVEKASPARETITLGHAVLGEASKDLHAAGLKSLIGEMNLLHSVEFGLKENVSLDKDIRQCKILYLTGNTAFELTTKQQEVLGAFLESGGIIFGEGCSDGQAEAGGKGAKEFGLAFNQLASQLNCKLENVQRGHPLLSSAYVFSAVPEGAETGMLLAGGKMVYSAGDYGCAWQGGRPDQPLSREIIRSSIEIATNIIKYGQG